MLHFQWIELAAMDGSASLPLERDEATNCINWRGPLSSDGDPVWYFRGKQLLIGRYAFAAAYGWLSLASRLRRVCPSPRCISAYHRVIQNPEGFAKHLDYGPADVRGVATFLRGRLQREPEEGICWDVGQLQRLGLHKDRMREWGERLDEAPLLVLAAYASLVRASERTLRRASPPPND